VAIGGFVVLGIVFIFLGQVCVADGLLFDGVGFLRRFGVIPTESGSTLIKALSAL
jgi:hypothetical protein